MNTIKTRLIVLAKSAVVCALVLAAAASFIIVFGVAVEAVSKIVSLKTAKEIER